MNKFIEMLKKQKAEKMGKVVLKEKVETSPENNTESLYNEDETIDVDNKDVIEKPKKKRWGKLF